MQDIELETEKVAVKEPVSIETVQVDDKRAKGRYVVVCCASHTPTNEAGHQHPIIRRFGRYL